MDLFSDFFGQKGFLPHAYCLTWTPGLLWTMVLADALTVVAYFSIPAFIVTFVRQRRDLQYRWVWIASGVLVFGSCGTGHLWDVWVTWVPDYYAHAAIKVFTAVVSLGSAVVLWPLLPRLLAIPSSRQLQEAIAQLESEVARRKTVEEHLADTERSLASALGIIGAGFVTADTHGRILRMNGVAEQLTGWNAAEAAGRSVSEVIHASPGSPIDVGAFTDITTLSAAGSHTTLSLPLARRGGGEARVQLTAGLDHDEHAAVRGMTLLMRDETELKTAEHEVERLAAIVESTSDAIVSCTPHGTITSWNHGAEHLFGFAASEAIGQNIVMLVPEDLRDDAARLAREVTSGQHIPHFDTQRQRRTGERVDVAVTLSPVLDAEGRVSGYSMIASDVTERRQAQAALLRANQLEAENRRVIEDRYTAERERRRTAETLAENQRNASRAKTEFLATINHELRTPLNAILGMAELARSPDVDEPVRRGYLNQIVTSGKEMADLMSQVLDMTRIESGRLDLENVVFDLSTLLAGVRNTYAPLANARGLQFDSQSDRRLPRMVFGDPLRLRQIINNLMANALKFTLRGGINLSVRQIAVNRYRFEVSDTGIGIDANALERLFQPYAQASNSTTREYGGTGLGLYICKQLAQLMGGDVGVRSSPGDGSTFWADVELAGVTLAASADAAVEQPLPDVAGLRVLVVDDNLINREVVSTMLERAQVSVTQACNGREAVDAVAASGDTCGFDVVLLDMRMPVMGGIEATQQIRALQNGADLPIIAFTADTMSEDRERVFEAGADDLLAKPIDKQRLFGALHDVTRGRGRRGRVAGDTP